jgi:tetratricopeptide (TPR) repeat protein
VNVTGSRDFRSGHYDVTGSEGAGQYNVTVSGGRGVYIGDHGIQVNLFTGEPPPGPVVAGNVPQAPRAFRPREDLMVRLRSAGPGVPVVRAVTGMRGVGKTQLAAAYARERIDAGWRLVAWVSAEDTPAILNGLAVVAARLGMDRPGVALEIVGAEVRNRLEADGDRCLIVFDNVTDPDAVRPYLPSAGHAQAVITSTDISTAGLGAPVSVDVFTEAESLGFLAERTGRTDQEGAADLAEELGQLPLALAQAAAVMSAQHLTYPVYLDRLLAYPTERYLIRAKGDPYPRGVAEAIGLSVDAVTSADPNALAGLLLDVISLLSPQGVSRDLLHLGPSAGVFAAAPAPATATGAAADAPPPHGAPAAPAAIDEAMIDEAAIDEAAIDEAAIDEAVIDEAIGRLADASLLAFGGDDTVVAHRLTMRAVRERAERRPGDGFLLAARACMLLDAARAALGEPRLNRVEVRVFAQHVAALTGHVASSPAYRWPDAAMTEALAVRLINLRTWAVAFLNLAGDAVTQAVGIAEPLLADCEAAFGQAHPAAPSIRNSLGYAYRAAGRLDDAIAQYERVLADRARLSGPDHPDTLTCRNNLGVAYKEAGRAAEAIELLQRTVADRERVLGADHPDTLTSRNNLASAYLKAERLSDALQQHAETLAARERVLGPDHPDTLNSRSNLASAILEAGQSDEALPLLEQVVADYERRLGDEHPDTLNARCHLANCHYALGRSPETIAQYEKAVAGFERQLGPAHPLTVNAQANLNQARAGLPPTNPTAKPPPT